MAKNKRKLSAAQTDKYNIQVAKFLKKAGVLSKRTNLNQGRYISRAALKKVREFEFVYLNNYKAAKVSRDYLAKAREQGYSIVNGRVIVPKRENVQKRIDAGMIVGVTPVKGGTMESVITPYKTLPDLMRAMQRGELDRLKAADEMFTFSISGNMAYSGSYDSTSLAEYLLRYQSMNDALEDGETAKQVEYFKNLVIFRLNRNDIMRAVNRGENRGKNRKPSKSYAERQKRLRQLGEIAYENRMKQKALAQAEYRQKLKETDPVKYQEQLARARSRMAKRRGKT